jgi:hypothetical protein
MMVTSRAVYVIEPGTYKPASFKRCIPISTITGNPFIHYDPIHLCYGVILIHHNGSHVYSNNVIRYR